MQNTQTKYAKNMLMSQMRCKICRERKTMRIKYANKYAKEYTKHAIKYAIKYAKYSNKYA